MIYTEAMVNFKNTIGTFALFLCLIYSRGAVGEEKKIIRLAVSNAVSGPASQLGIRLNQGAQAYFSKVNQQSDTLGFSVEMLAKDDGYEPFKTLKNTQYFIQQEDIFAFFNYVGTPTTHAILPEIKKSTLPFLTPFTGAEFLRNPIIKNVFNLRASYYQEARRQIEFLVSEKNITEIGLLVQADEFGSSVERGYLMAMKDRGITPVVTTRYRRNTQDIATALNILKEKKVKAIGFVGTYEPLAELVNMAHKQGFTPFFTTVSFISSHDLFIRINQHSDILVTEVMPEPSTCQVDFCKQFILDMKEHNITDVDQVQLEGYLNAYAFVEVLKECKKDLTPECFLKRISDFELPLDDLKITFSEGDHQGLDNVYLNIFDLNKYAQID